MVCVMRWIFVICSYTNMDCSYCNGQADGHHQHFIIRAFYYTDLSVEE